MIKHLSKEIPPESRIRSQVRKKQTGQKKADE